MKLRLAEELGKIIGRKEAMDFVHDVVQVTKIGDHPARYAVSFYL